MIVPNELRIGSMLNYQTSEGDIIPIVIDWKDLKWITEDPIGFNAVHEPIQLTRKMVKGIMKDNPFNDEHLKVWTSLTDNDVYFEILTYNIKMTYLHQFQNIYFALTNKILFVNLGINLSPDLTI